MKMTILKRKILKFKSFLIRYSSSNNTNIRQFWPNNYIEKSAVYIHWPYCRQRCSYCNFVKFVPKTGTHWTFENEIIEEAMVRLLS